MSVNLTHKRSATNLLDIYNKPAIELPISKDLIRLCRRMFVYGENGVQLNTHVKEHSKLESAFQYIKALCAALDPDKLHLLSEEQFNTQVTETNVDNFTMNQYFVRLLGEDCNTIRVLKLCNQACLAPAVLHMKGKLEGKLSYKDVHCGWAIHVYTKGFKDLTNCVCVVHNKKEKVEVVRGSDRFTALEFEWHLCIALNDEMDHFQEVHAYIESIDFISPEITDEQKELVKISLKEVCSSFYSE